MFLGRNMSLTELKSIADTFSVSTDYLLGLSESKEIKNLDISRELGLSDNSIKTLKYFKNVDDTTKKVRESLNESSPTNSISTNTIVNLLLDDKSFFETISEYIMLEIINNDEIEQMRESLNIPKELYEYTRLSKILNKILELKNSLLKDFYHK